MTQKRGRDAGPKPAPQAKTIPELIEQLGGELAQLDQEISADAQALAQKRERAQFLRGQLTAYSSIRFDDPNPPAFENGSEA